MAQTLKELEMLEKGKRSKEGSVRDRTEGTPIAVVSESVDEKAEGEKEKEKEDVVTQGEGDEWGGDEEGSVFMKTADWAEKGEKGWKAKGKRERGKKR